MLITGIEKTKRGRYSIFIDGSFLFSLHGDVLYASHLKEGCEVTPEKLEELRYDSDYIITKERALRLLSARPYTVGMLRKKLAEYAIPEAVDAVIARMLELELLDDCDYAVRYIKDAINIKGYSKTQIMYKLKEKHIPRETAEDAFMEVTYNPLAQIKKLVEKKYKLEDEKSIRKAVNGLLRRGFSYSDIKSVIGEIIEESG